MAVANSKDNIYYLERPVGSSLDLKKYVLVNDEVWSGGTYLANVLSVESTRVIVDKDIAGSSQENFTFRRKTQDISNWFQTGFSNIETFRMKSSRLSGSINIKSGFSKIKDDSYPALDLSDNCLTGYEAGFKNIFSGSNRKITLDLSYNNFSVDTLRSMISELLDIDATKKFTNVKIVLNGCKREADGSAGNYPQNELFPVSIIPASDQKISLTRVEKVKIFDSVTVVDAEGNESTSIQQVGTKNITVSAKQIGSTYYRTQINSRQQIVEDPLGIKLKKSVYFNFNLGFTYTSPNTSPTVTSTTYDDETTRAQTLREALNLPSSLTDNQVLSYLA
jgi:hypothetical protein